MNLSYHSTLSETGSYYHLAIKYTFCQLKHFKDYNLTF